jgi:hypothetical protein
MCLLSIHKVISLLLVLLSWKSICVPVQVLLQLHLMCFAESILLSCAYVLLLLLQ